ncbi:hypothetical protein KKC32_01640 [Patescibacteria group bacterium]|nr:hypothetical protein [Patescibacteria group bacterium]
MGRKKEEGNNKDNKKKDKKPDPSVAAKAQKKAEALERQAVRKTARRAEQVKNEAAAAERRKAAEEIRKQKQNTNKSEEATMLSPKPATEIPTTTESPTADIVSHPAETETVQPAPAGDNSPILISSLPHYIERFGLDVSVSLPEDGHLVDYLSTEEDEPMNLEPNDVRVVWFEGKDRFFSSANATMVARLLSEERRTTVRPEALTECILRLRKEEEARFERLAVLKTVDWEQSWVSLEALAKLDPLDLKPAAGEIDAPSKSALESVFPPYLRVYETRVKSANIESPGDWWLWVKQVLDPNYLAGAAEGTRRVIPFSRQAIVVKRLSGDEATYAVVMKEDFKLLQDIHCDSVLTPFNAVQAILFARWFVQREEDRKRREAARQKAEGLRARIRGSERLGRGSPQRQGGWQRRGRYSEDGDDA